MPIYVYACDTCEKQFEQFQSFNDAPLESCPSCNSSVRRVFQPVGIVFKGSGWYVTDSRKTTTSDSDTSKGDKGDSADTGTTTEASKAESKADAKSATEPKADTKPTTEPKADAKPAA